MIPAPQYTLHEAIGVCLAMCQRALSEVRALAPTAGTTWRERQARASRREANAVQGRDRPQRQRPDVPAGLRSSRSVRAVQDRIGHHADGGRTLRWAIGDTVHEIKTAIVLDAGVWKEGAAYAAATASRWAARSSLRKPTPPPSRARPTMAPRRQARDRWPRRPAGREAPARAGQVQIDALDRHRHHAGHRRAAHHRRAGAGRSRHHRRLHGDRGGDRRSVVADRGRARLSPRAGNRHRDVPPGTGR